jgi:hypothetical protein
MLEDGVEKKRREHGKYSTHNLNNRAANSVCAIEKEGEKRRMKGLIRCIVKHTNGRG